MKNENRSTGGKVLRLRTSNNVGNRFLVVVSSILSIGCERGL